jgi:hypothetical protein
MASKFQEGVVVQIKKSSTYHKPDDSSNPIGIKGKVTRNDGTSDHNVYVSWDNGSSNVYNEHDLKIITEVDENLLKEMYYKDECDDVLEVDTECSGQVYVRTGEGDNSDDFVNEGKTVMLNRKQVKKIRKQLKAWLDKFE